MQQLFPAEGEREPKLRFKVFSGEWKQKKLGDVFIGKKGQGLSKKDVVKNGKNKCILYGELYTRYSEVIKEVYSHTHSSAGVKSKLKLSFPLNYW
jgi:type I restriction enzyme S subunit